MIEVHKTIKINVKYKGKFDINSLIKFVYI